MDVTIEQSCPSCGAAIVLREDDRIIECGFCAVHNYKIGNGPGRYVLPATIPANVDEHELFYAPYLRFKGSIFYVRDNAIQHKIVDTTRLGLDNRLMPVSLGLRPQAMRLKPVVSSMRGSFIRQTIPTHSVFARAAMVVDLFTDKSNKTCLHRAFIGETISCIYQPCYIKDERLIDAVTSEIMGGRRLSGDDLQAGCPGKSLWEPRFIATLCPQCGGLLSGKRDAIVLQCDNCHSLWQEQNGRFVALACTVVATESRVARYLPFWQISFTTDGCMLHCFADFLRFTNQPLVSMPQYRNRALVFWIPAFKIHPKAFLQLASQLTVGQTRIPEGQSSRVSDDYPVTLAQQEALQAIKSVLAYSTLSKEKRLPLLPQMSLKAKSCQLTYLPFAAKTHDLVQEHTSAAVQTAALRYGRAL